MGKESGGKNFSKDKRIKEKDIRYKQLKKESWKNKRRRSSAFLQIIN